MAPPFHSLDSYLPHPDPTTPYWRSAPNPRDEESSTAPLPPSCDTLIIGTGITGVSTAYHLLTHPAFADSSSIAATDSSDAKNPKVLLVEARPGICAGATARNGGHLKAAFLALDQNRKRYGADVAAEMIAFDVAQIDAMEEVVRREGIDCEFRKGRSWDVFLDKSQADENVAKWNTWKKEDWEALKGLELYSEDEQELEELCGVRDAKLAINSPAAMVWAYKLVAGLLERCLEKGAMVRTAAPAHHLEKIGEYGSRWLVKTARGDVCCNRVVVATNAYTAGVLPEFDGVIRPVKGVNSLMTGPPDSKEYKLGMNSLNIDHAPKLANYTVPQPSGSIINGGAFKNFPEVDKERFDTVDDSTLMTGTKGSSNEDWGLNNVLPRWVKGCEEMDKGPIWSGIMGYTPDNNPHVGHVPGRPNVFVAAGFNGRGMLIIFLATKGLVKVILEGGSIRDAGVPSPFETSEERLRQKWE